jgi:predicted DNA-binding transcriptional regulator YafY
MVTKNPLKIFYSDIKGKRSNRKLDPLKLINYSGKWYLAAFCYKAKDYRNFSLKRISYIEIISEENSDRYNVHEIDKIIESNFGIFKNRDTVKARIRFDKNGYYVVKDQLWHPDQKLAIDEEKKVAEMELPVSDYTEILGKVLSFGADAEVLEPKEFRDLWLTRIEEIYQRFSK